MFAYLQTWFGFGRLHEEGEGVRGGGGVTCGILVLVFEDLGLGLRGGGGDLGLGLRGRGEVGF